MCSNHDQGSLSRKISKLLPMIHKQELRLESVNNIRLSFGISSLISFGTLSIWPASPSNPLVYFSFIFITGFLLFISVSLKNKAYLKKLKSYFLFLERQHLRRSGLPSRFTYSNIGKSPAIPFDLGLIGEHSLLGLLDETWTSEGLNRLISNFESGPIEIELIENRQTQVKSLKSIIWPLIRLRITVEKRLDSAENSLRSYLEQPIWSKSPLKIILLLFFTWLAWLFLLTSDIEGPLGPILVLSFPIINLAFLKKWSLYFNGMVGIIHQLEHLTVSYKFIQNHKNNFAIKSLLPEATQNSPLGTLKDLERSGLFLGTQANPVLHLIVNFISPWSAVGALMSYRSIRRSKLKQVLEELPNLEVLLSYGIFYYYQSQNFPTIESGHFNFEDMIHPLIPRGKVINNSFSLHEGDRVIFLTGSNMSGKSTFLRAIGINQLLANMGLPVFAKQFVTGPLAIQTCIEVTDSVREGFSYFYSEVRRLCEINRLAEKGVPLLILVDELFRGTNNSERRIGSRGLIKKWSSLSSSISLISSHDLDLAEEAVQFKHVACYHFKDDVNPTTNQMTFDYKIYPGPSMTTNALKIMKFEGLFYEGDFD